MKLSEARNTVRLAKVDIKIMGGDDNLESEEIAKNMEAKLIHLMDEDGMFIDNNNENFYYKVWSKYEKRNNTLL